MEFAELEVFEVQFVWLFSFSSSMEQCFEITSLHGTRNHRGTSNGLRPRDQGIWNRQDSDEIPTCTAVIAVDEHCSSCLVLIASKLLIPSRDAVDMSCRI